MSQQGLCGLMNPSSPMKAVSGAILELATTQFSLTVSESKGLCGLTNPFITCASSLEGYF